MLREDLKKERNLKDSLNHKNKKHENPYFIMKKQVIKSGCFFLLFFLLLQNVMFYASATINFQQYEDPLGTLRKYDLEDIENLPLMIENNFTQFEDNQTQFLSNGDLLTSFIQNLNQLDYEKSFSENRGSDIFYFNMYDQNGFIYLRTFWKGDYTQSDYRKNKGRGFFTTKATTSNLSLNVMVDLANPVNWNGWEVFYNGTDYEYSDGYWGMCGTNLDWFVEFQHYDYYDPLWYEPPDKTDITELKLGLRVSYDFFSHKIGDWFQDDFNFKEDAKFIFFTFDEDYEHVYIEILPRIIERFLPDIELIIWLFVVSFLLVAIIVVILGFRKGYLKLNYPKSSKRERAR